MTFQVGFFDEAICSSLRDCLVFQALDSGVALPEERETYQLVYKLDTIDEEHQEGQPKVDFAKQAFLFLLGIRLIVCMKDLQSQVAILNFVGLDIRLFDIACCRL